MKEIPLLFALFMGSFALAQNSTDNFSGQWKTDKGILIEITRSGSGFIGKLQGKDTPVLKDLVFIEGKWIGMLVNPQKNTTANCEAYLEGNKIRLVASKGRMKREVFWSKTN